MGSNPRPTHYESGAQPAASRIMTTDCMFTLLCKNTDIGLSKHMKEKSNIQGNCKLFFSHK